MENIRIGNDILIYFPIIYNNSTPEQIRSIQFDVFVMPSVLHNCKQDINEICSNEYKYRICNNHEGYNWKFKGFYENHKHTCKLIHNTIEKEDGQFVLEVYWPAYHQHLLGEYDIVVVRRPCAIGQCVCDQVGFVNLVAHSECADLLYTEDAQPILTLHPIEIDLTGNSMKDVNMDDKLYARRNRQWEEIQKIVIDTESDLLHVDGKTYKLTEYIERNPDYIIYGDWTIGDLSGISGNIPSTGGTYTLSATAKRTKKQHYTDGYVEDLEDEITNVSLFSVTTGNATISGNVLTVGQSTLQRTITIRAVYETKTRDFTYTQQAPVAPPVVAYYGSSDVEPVYVDTSHSKTLTGSSVSISIEEVRQNAKKSLYVAVPKNSGWLVKSVTDPLNTSINFYTKEIDDMTVYYTLSVGYLNTTYTFTIKK